MTSSAALDELVDAEKLDDAIEWLNQSVKKNPTAVEERVRLAELLCVAGKLDRADTILDAVFNIDPSTMIGVAMFRQLVRAEQAREQYFREGRLPEFVKKPDEILELELRAGIAAREGATEEVARLIEAREAARSPVAGTANGVAFDDFRDLDDLHAAHLEVFTSTGKYFWIPVSDITAIEFRKPKSRRDLLWRRALVVIDNGPDGEVFLPSIYSSAEMSSAHRLGFVTDFDEPSPRVHFGKGLRTYLVGDSSQTILDFSQVAFANHSDT